MESAIKIVEMTSSGAASSSSLASSITSTSQQLQYPTALAEREATNGEETNQWKGATNTSPEKHDA